jgi:hypothetical protein
MKNWAKSYWSNCLSIVAIVCSIVAICISLPTNKSLGIDYIGVIVGILSFLVTMLMGWQIYNAVTIEQKIKDEVNRISDSLKDEINQANDKLKKSIESTREDLSISGVRSMTATLYKIENTYLNVCLLAGDYRKAINTLKIMVEYAIALNEYDRLREIVKTIIDSKQEICKRILEPKDYEIIYSSFLELSQSGLTHLVASDDYARQLYVMMEEIRYNLNELKKPTE